MLLIVLAAGFVGFWIARPSVDTTSAEMDVITLSVQGAENVNVEYETQSREHASRYIRDKSGRRVSAPSIAEATLTGVGMTEVRPGIEVPVFMYRERSRDVLVVYAYNYAFLDRHVGAVNLEPSIFHTIADEHNRYVHEMGGEKVVIWRHADDIFVAVTPTNAENLKTRIFSY